MPAGVTAENFSQHGGCSGLKRLHVDITVDDFDKAVHFSSALLGADTAQIKTDYSMWLLVGWPVNLAISTRSARIGIDHLGIQVSEETEAAEVIKRLAGARAETTPELATTCCYARSDKHWTHDPAGIPWEIYRTLEDAEIYGHGRPGAAAGGRGGGAPGFWWARRRRRAAGRARPRGSPRPGRRAGGRRRAAPVR